MSQINEQARKQYLSLIDPYKKKISEFAKIESKLMRSIKGGGTSDAAKKYLELTEQNLSVVSYYLAMNTLALSLLGISEKSHINNGRKTCYKAILMLEKIFTNHVDVPFSEYEDSLKATSFFPEMERYKLIRKTGLAISMVKDCLEENNKWKWSIVELEARLAIVAKNCLNLKEMFRGMDPRQKGSSERTEYFKMVRTKLENAADNYRVKYEISTNRRDDFRLAISYLGVLKKLLQFYNQEEANELGKKIDIWKFKMEKDELENEKSR